MAPRLDLVSLIVDDYDRAIAFFANQLGFEVVEDTPDVSSSGAPKRWVVMRPPGGGTGMVIARAEGHHQREAIGCQFAGRVGMFVRVPDFADRLEALREAGCEIVRPARKAEYGWVAVFRDPWGNLWDLLSEEPRHAFAARWSPLAFDPDHSLSNTEVELLQEAARWAPSAGNSQPWAFVAVARDTERYAQLTRLLAPSARVWAPDASLLVVNLCQRRVPGTDWAYSEFAEFDLGQAVAHMTLQAHTMGLASRQFAAFDRAGVTALLEPPAHWDVVTMTAFGRAGGPAPGGRARRPRVDEQSLHGS